MSILPDHNIEGIVSRMHSLWQSDEWGALWADLGCGVESFASLAIDTDASDETIWELCQARSILLITANRNASGADALETVVRRRNQAHHLPVITIANAERVLKERPYARHVAEAMLDRLLLIDQYRGAGRIYVP